VAKIVVAKIEAAKRQINTAIKLFFTDGDPVSIHTLAMAAFGILKNLSEIDSEAQVIESMKHMIVPGKERDFWNQFNSAANFFKHADRDPHEVLRTMDDVANEAVIILCISLYRDLGFTISNEMTWFFTFVGVCYPDLLQDQTEYKTKILKLRGGVRNYSNEDLLILVKDTANLKHPGIF